MTGRRLIAGSAGVAGGRLAGELPDLATTAADDEAEHTALLARLVPDPPDEPAYDLGGDASDPPPRRSRALAVAATT